MFEEAKDIPKILKDIKIARKYPSGFNLKRETPIFQGNGIQLSTLDKNTKVYQNFWDADKIKTGKKLNVRDIHGKKIKKLYKEYFTVVSIKGYDRIRIGYIPISYIDFPDKPEVEIS